VPESLRDGRYVIVGSLGEGTQGHTFDAVDKREGRPVAVKRFDVRTAKTWKDAELAERETRVLQSLSHPKLPRYVDHFEQDGALYLVMDKIDGESLSALQKRGAVLGEEDVVRLLRDAADALDYLHRRAPPVIHRDLKPGNVIRRPDGSFAFVDFGAVRDKLRPEGGSTVVGTFGYMAPEQFQGRALPASDVYAIGATALSMLTGRQPEDLPHKGLAIDVRAALQGRASGRLTEALVAMLDPDPDRRPARIEPVIARLRSGRPAAGSAPSASSAAPLPPFDPQEFAQNLSARFQQFVRHAEEYEQRAREYEDRARSGGPGARGWMRHADDWRKGARKWREQAERHAAHLAREADRRARKQGRKAQRRAEIQARHQSRHLHRHGGALPWPIALFFVLGLTVAAVAVVIGLHVVAPAVLRFIALFFPRREAHTLQAAADVVRQAGDTAIARMDGSRQRLLAGAVAPNASIAGQVDETGQTGGAPSAEPSDRIRVEPHKVRVGTADAEPSDEALADDESDVGAARR
jgi:serine/threonine protein kinase